MWSPVRRERSIGTAPRQTARWRTSPSTRNSTARWSRGWRKSAMNSTGEFRPRMWSTTHDGHRGMGELLRHRRLVGRRPDRIAVRRHFAICLKADRPPRSASRQRLRNAERCSFGLVLLLSAIVSAPWDEITVVAVLWGILGLGGVAYVVIVARRMRKQSAYRPVFEDWLFHVVLPFAAYAVLAVSAFAAPYSARPALFLVGAAALVLLSIGIHNAWDAVTYQVFVRSWKDA